LIPICSTMLHFLNAFTYSGDVKMAYFSLLINDIQ